MINIVKKNLNLSKLENLTLLSAITGITLAFGMCNIYWILNKLGIHLASDTLQNILDSVSAGSSLSTAFAAIAGITLPAWAIAAAGALGATAA